MMSQTVSAVTATALLVATEVFTVESAQWCAPNTDLTGADAGTRSGCWSANAEADHDEDGEGRGWYASGDLAHDDEG